MGKDSGQLSSHKVCRLALSRKILAVTVTLASGECNSTTTVCYNTFPSANNHWVTFVAQEISIVGGESEVKLLWGEIDVELLSQVTIKELFDSGAGYKHWLMIRAEQLFWWCWTSWCLLHNCDADVGLS